MNSTREEKKTEAPSQPQEKMIALTKSITEKLSQFAIDLPHGDKWNVTNLFQKPFHRAFTSKEKILKVPAKVKAISDEVAFKDKKTLIHIDHFHSDLSILAISEFKDSLPYVDSLPTLLITTISKKGERNHFYIRDTTLCEEIDNLRELALTLGVAEFTILKHLLEQSGTILAHAWGQFEWDHPKQHGLYYDKISDTLIIEQYASHVLPLASTLEKDQPLIILDIGAGKGRLAEKILLETVNNQLPIHYIFVEPSDKQLKIAREKLNRFSAAKNCKITFIQSTFEKLDLKEKVHAIISSGGPFNMTVIENTVAKENVKKASKLLLPEGFFISTGITPSLVKAKHFKAQGFKILSTTAPCFIPKGLEKNEFLKQCTAQAGFFGHYQRYVCQKTAEAKDDLPVAPGGPVGGTKKI